MEIVKCWIEHPVRRLDQTFEYASDVPIRQGCRVLIPFGKRQLVGFVESCEPMKETMEEYRQRNGFALKKIDRVLDEEPLITEELHDLAFYMKDITLSTTISCFQAMLPSIVKPSSHQKKAVVEKWVKVSVEQCTLTPRQLEAYLSVKQAKEMPYSQLRKNYPNQAHVLLEKRALISFTKEKTAVSEPLSIASAPYPLNKEQKEAIHQIVQSDDLFFLLKGVTGSGKTEVYFQLAQKVLEEGRQVLFLVPEIGLTPMMIERVRKRFGSYLAVYHSGLNAQEKYEQYRLVHQGRAGIVVGTRSAVFLPFDNLGLIIMDEEHDTSYKQESQPAYHTRDIAMFRCSYHHARLIMGSATPSLDSYARALKHVYHPVILNHRVNDTMPEIHVVNMKEAMEAGENEMICDELRDGIALRLARREQVILLLNRRGFHSLLKCRSCQEVLKCPHCDLAMSYHKDGRIMKCHTCGYQMRVPVHCPSCHSNAGFTTYGFGTQKLQEQVEQMFPSARIIRMDADTTGKKNAHHDLLTAFGNHEADILVGTQMIAKGLDYPDVTLVGIVNGDEGLNRTDYRSCEVTFDLLMQAAGRSGRSEDRGEVILQVNDPMHYAVRCAAANDYDSFFTQEMAYRHTVNAPPYTYLISITVSAYSQEKCNTIAGKMHDGIKGNFITGGVIELLRKKDLYRSRILLKGKDLKQMRQAVSDWLDSQKNKPEGVRIDVNPLVLD